jgi:hypothetical protein
MYRTLASRLCALLEGSVGSELNIVSSRQTQVKQIAKFLQNMFQYSYTQLSTAEGYGTQLTQ